jgi:hypothetical protein
MIWRKVSGVSFGKQRIERMEVSFLVNWEQICKPLEFGGLGIKNMRLQGLALRVKWQWMKRIDMSRP